MSDDRVRNNLCTGGLYATKQESQEPKNVFQMSDSVHVTNRSNLPNIPYMLLFISKNDALLCQSLGLLIKLNASITADVSQLLSK